MAIDAEKDDGGKQVKPCSEIQIWADFPATDVSSDTMSNKLLIQVEDDAVPLPEDLEDKVEENWRNASAKQPLKDNPILFLKSPVAAIDGHIMIDTNIRGFRYTHAFNRNKDFQPLVAELNKYRLLHTSTHAHLLTKDNKLLFGTKKNQFNQISGFSGFPNAAEDCIEIAGIKYLDIYGTIKNRLTAEMGYLTRAVKDMYALGIVYVDTPGLRGTDTDYLIRLDETADKARERFIESFQFDKELHAVDFHPDRIMEFIVKLHEDGKKMSKYALGCEYLVMKNFFGEEAAAKLEETIRAIGISFSRINETSYFNEGGK